MSIVQVLMIDETAWGTTPGTPAGGIIPCDDADISSVKRNLIASKEYTGDVNPRKPFKGNESAPWTFMPTLHLDAIGRVLKHAVGTPATTGTGPYTHIFKTGNALPAGFTGEVGETDLDEYFPLAGSRIARFSGTVSSEGGAVFTCACEAKGLPTPAQTSLVASPTVYTSGQLSQFACTLQKGGSAWVDIAEMSFELDNHLDTSRYSVGGAGKRKDLRANRRTVGGSMTLFFEDDSYIDAALAETEYKIDIIWTEGAYSLTLEFEEIIIEPTLPKFGGPDQGPMLQCNWIGYYGDGANAAALKATLVNTVASY